MNDRATFTRMQDRTAEDWARLLPEAMQVAATLAPKDGVRNAMQQSAQGTVAS